MGDGRPFVWTHFVMTIASPLVKRSSSTRIVAFQLMQLLVVKMMLSKKKWQMMKQMLKGDEAMLLLLTFCICIKRRGRHINKYCFLVRHWTHICIEHCYYLLDECHCKEKKLKNKIDKL
jgi:hypothetical protein